jgi:ribosome-associated translation inhibitor RaiA
MRWTDGQFRVEVTSKGCDIPADERARLQALLAPVVESVNGLPGGDLAIDVVHHPHSGEYHAKFKLKLPGRALFSGEQAPYLDTALQRAAQKLAREVEAYQERPDGEAVAAAERRSALDNEVVPPEGPDAGPLAEAATAGDYRAFRTALAGYEEWLRGRVGRLVQRRPEAQARVGKELLLGDVVEEVYLNAFEQFTRRPTAVRLSEWLEGLIDPAIRALLRHPDEGREAASMARTVREAPLG